MVCVGDMAKVEPMFISEGIEDLLTAANLTGTRGIATLGSGRLAKMTLPRATRLVLLGQKKSEADRANWLKAAELFAAQGCEVEIVWPGNYVDINELLVAEGPNAVKTAIESAEAVEGPANQDEPGAASGGGDADDKDDDNGGMVVIGNYGISDHGIAFYAKAPNAVKGNWVWLTNFTAKIKSQIRMDDGVEATHTFEIEAKINGQTSTFPVPSAQFGSMNWVLEKLGAEAVVYPNQEKRAKVGIQVISGIIPRRSVYAHTGFRFIGGEHVYLHAGGALGADGPLDSIEVQLPTGLENYLLETDGTTIGDHQLREAVEASMGVISVAPLDVTIPLHASMPRAIIGGADYTPHLVGKTGACKTELLALEAQHFGAGMNSRALPGSWSSTDNYLEAQASALKDAVYPIDDFVTVGSGVEAARLAAKADRVLRAQGNASGRGRLRSDATMRRARPPRGLAMSTGEDVPPGHSLRARLLVIPVALGAVDLEKLTVAQQHGESGTYARATAGFIRWVAPQYEKLRKEFGELTHQFRTEFPDGVHGRTADIFAQVMATWKVFMRFVVATGAWTQEDADAHLKDVWETLNALIVEQSAQQRVFDAVARFQTNLDSALAAGKAHIGRHTHPDRPPSNCATGLGWKRVEASGELRWQSSGPCVGWYADDGFYLDGEAAYAAAQAAAAATGSGIGVGVDTLYRRMRDDNLLLSLETRGGKTYFKVRKTIAGRRRPVIHVAHAFLHLEAPASSNGSPSSPNGPEDDFD
jgi:hypothetical protein